MKRLILPVLVVLVAVTASAMAIISVEQEIEIGREAQQQVRQQVPQVPDASVRNYVAGIGRRLAVRASGPKYPYSFSVANRSAQIAQVGARVLAGGYMLKFSRDDEREADAVGATILRRAGWDAREMVAFMETLRRQQGRDPASIQVFLSSHPAPAERAQLLRQSVKAGGTKDSAAFRRIKARLAKMPAAPPMKRSSRNCEF